MGWHHLLFVFPLCSEVIIIGLRPLLCFRALLGFRSLYLEAGPRIVFLVFEPSFNEFQLPFNKKNRKNTNIYIDL